MAPACTHVASASSSVSSMRSHNSWWVLGRVYGIGVGSGGGVTRWRDGESALLKSLVQ